MMTLYELTYILRPDLEEDVLSAAQDRIAARFTDVGGEIVKSEPWGRRKLAFPIDKVREGLYFTSILRLPGAEVRNVENQLKLVPEILRFLLIRQEERNINMTGSLLPAQRPAAARPAPATVEAAAATAEAAPPATIEEAQVQPVEEPEVAATAAAEGEVAQADGEGTESSSETADAGSTTTEPDRPVAEEPEPQGEPPAAEPEPAQVAEPEAAGTHEEIPPTDQQIDAVEGDGAEEPAVKSEAEA